MDAERVEMQIAALLDQADVEHARIAKAITDLQATGVALQQDVTRAAGSAVRAVCGVRSTWMWEPWRVITRPTIICAAWSGEPASRR